MNVRFSQDSSGNSGTGDDCERRDEAFAQGGMMAVEMQKSLVDILKELKESGYLLHHFSGCLRLHKQKI